MYYNWSNALNRYYEVVEYFLINGLALNKAPLDESVMMLTRACKYIPDEPPVELLQLLLDFGAPVDFIEK